MGSRCWADLLLALVSGCRRQPRQLLVLPRGEADERERISRPRRSREPRGIPGRRRDDEPADFLLHPSRGRWQVALEARP